MKKGKIEYEIIIHTDKAEESFKRMRKILLDLGKVLADLKNIEITYTVQEIPKKEHIILKSYRKFKSIFQ